MLQFLKNKYLKAKSSMNIYAPYRWLKAAYLTLVYVDKWGDFPAIQFNGAVKVRIQKGPYSRLVINKKLVFEQWLSGNAVTTITLRNHAELEIDNEFVLGDGVRLFVSSGGRLLIKGKKNEPVSGITADAVVMVKKYVEIGDDAMIAWNTYITDCDWHGIEGKEAVKETIIKEHVWLGIGAKILKGVTIEEGSIVTANSIVLQGSYPERSLISGNPASVVKQNVPAWSQEMKPNEA